MSRAGLRSSQVRTAYETFFGAELPLGARLSFLRHGFGHPGRNGDAYSLRIAGGRVYVSYANDKTDRSVLREIFHRRCYAAADFRDAVVVDVGAHKGYFGAYAVMRGASEVVSYEPELLNHEFLERTAASFRRARWTTHRAAVGAEDGEVELRVSTESWSHAVAGTGGEAHKPSDAVQRVPSVSMQTVLEEAERTRAGRRLVVKVDAEGAECGIVLASPAGMWQGVDELFLEAHDFAACRKAALRDRLVEAGLALRSDDYNVLHMTRAATPGLARSAA